MWIYAHAAKAELPKLPAAKKARKRVSLKWYHRALRQAEQAGRDSARQMSAHDMFDTSAADASIDAFLDEHAPDSLPVRPDATDFEIVEKARKIAADVALRIFGLSNEDALPIVVRTCQAHGVPLPDFELAAERVVRVKCEIWWRRQLRKLHIRAIAHSNIRLHYVHYRADPYASDDEVRRRVAQNRRNQQTLEAIVLENELGHQFTVAELAAKSISNKALKRGELFTRLRGCEELAVAAKFTGVMFTLTCPSRFHAVAQVGTGFKPNPKYCGSSPRDGQLYLRKMWQRIRAQLKREGVTYFGMRVAEPNHDATPHWHGLVFSNNIERFCAVMSKHGLRDSGEEKGAADHRVHFEVIDSAKGSAVGYVSKYISKNIDGYAVGDHKTKEGFVVQADFLGDDEITPSQRIETWAAQWGIRQFQQFGGAPVGVWRELRRVKEQDLPNEQESPEITAAWRAAQKTDTHKADWAEYARAMGGVAGEQRLIYVKRTTEHREGRYGIAPVSVPHGIAAKGVAHVVDGICNYHVETEIFVPATRYEWKVVSRSGAAASTRTCVNNCTDLADGGAEAYEVTLPIGRDATGKHRRKSGGGSLSIDRRPK